MPTFAGRPSTVSSTIPGDFPQNSMVGQQRQRTSELQFDKFPHPQSFLVWKIRFKNQVTTCSDFPSEAMLWIEEVENGWFISGIEFPAICFWEEFSIRDVSAKIASPLKKIIQNSHFKKKVSLEEQKVQKEDRFQRGRQVAFIICDYSRVTGAHDTVLDYADLLTSIFRN